MMEDQALAFEANGVIVRECWGRWLKKIMDKAAWIEACKQSDAYQEKMRQQRELEKAKQKEKVNGVANGSPRSQDLKRRMSSSLSLPKPGGESPQRKKARKRVSSVYQPPRTDEELAARFKQVRQPSHTENLITEICLRRTKQTSNADGPKGRSSNSFEPTSRPAFSHHQRSHFQHLFRRRSDISRSSCLPYGSFGCQRIQVANPQQSGSTASSTCLTRGSSSAITSRYLWGFPLRLTKACQSTLVSSCSSVRLWTVWMNLNSTPGFVVIRIVQCLTVYRKYLVLDDTSRLRQIIESFPQRRYYRPSILFMCWARSTDAFAELFQWVRRSSRLIKPDK
jgi:hypothetical protein